MSSLTQVTFLGTGTSQGVPIISCKCEVCTSKDSRDSRLRSSVLVQTDANSIVIDTGPDFRQQMLKNKVENLTAVLFTHEHKDHVAGLDDVRPFNFIQKQAIDVYAEARVQDALRREYAYIFSEEKYPGIPEINMHLIGEDCFYVGETKVIPIRLFHHKLPILGYRIGDFCYLTDMKTIPEPELEKLKGVKVLVVNALRKEQHLSHFNLDEALSFIELIKPQSAYLTHLSHRFGLHKQEEKRLPLNVKIAYDGLVLDI